MDGVRRAGSLVMVAAAISCGGSVTGVNGTPAQHPKGQLATRISGIPGRPFGIAVASNGVIAVTQQDQNTVTLTDTLGRTRRVIAVGADPGDVIFNRAGTRAWVSNFNDQSVTTIDVVAGTAVATTRLTANAYRLALSADESTLFVSSTSGKVFAIGTSTNTVTSSTQLSGSLQGMALSSAGDALYVSATEGTVYRLNAATLAVTASRSLGGLPQDVAVSPAGGEIYVANQSGWIDVLDAASLAPRAQVTSCGAFGLAVTRDGAQLYATCPASSVVVIADAASRTLLTTMGAATPRRIAFSANGEFAAVANEGNFVDIIR